jgi:hypothetical protein
LVGFPFAAEMVYPKMFSTASCCPLPHATSIAWRIALKQTFMFLLKVSKAINFPLPINIYWFYSKMFIGMILRDFLRNLNSKIHKTLYIFEIKIF